MLHTAELSTLRYASVDQFELMRDPILSGQRLAEIKAIEASIIQFGLQLPLTIIVQDGRHIVIDGRKRLAALRRLSFKNEMGGIVDQIPFRIGDMDHFELRDTAPLIARSKLYDAVRMQIEGGESIGATAMRYRLSYQCVRDILALGALHPRVRQAFFDKHIDFVQASAFMSIPDEAKQIALLRFLGPRVCAQTILEAARTDAMADETRMRVADLAA